ncbi:MAG: hypothetical protein WA867_21415 [Candidatus Acidiferrales bacterium]
MTAWFVKAANATPRNTKSKAHEEIKKNRSQPALLRVLDALAPNEPSVGIKLSLRIAVRAEQRARFTDAP